jgi:hypothetical protein
MLMRGKFCDKSLHFDCGYVTCLYAPTYLFATLVLNLWLSCLSMSFLACCSALCLFEKHMLAFVDVIHALPTRGEGSTQFMHPGGGLHQGREKLGKMHLFTGSLHFGSSLSLSPDLSCAL